MIQKESLTIRNFGPIKEIEIADIRPFLFLIGESGSGKSTILKVLAMMRHMCKYMNLRSYLKIGNVTDKTIDLSIEKYFKNGNLLDYKKDDSFFLYKKGACELEYSGGKLKGSRTLIGESDLSLEKISFLSDKRGAIASLLSTRNDGEDLGFYFQQTFEDFNLATEHIKRLEIPFLDIRYYEQKLSNGARQFWIGDLEKSYDVKFDGASSGMQTVTPLLLIAEYYSRKFSIIDTFNASVLYLLGRNDSLSSFRHDMNIGDIPNKTVHLMIEEPELSMFPSAQRSLINNLISYCQTGKTDMTLSIATHSPYIINHINLLVMANSKNILEEGVSLRLEDVGVYEVIDGYLQNLKIDDQSLINTRLLSDPISDIYERYNEIKGL